MTHHESCHSFIDRITLKTPSLLSQFAVEDGRFQHCNERYHRKRYDFRRRSVSRLRNSFHNLSHDTARISRRDDSVWDVLRHDASRSDDSFGPDLHSWTDNRSAPNPYVGTNFDGLAKFLFPTQFRVEWVSRRVNLDRRTEQRVVPDLDQTNVENNAVEVKVHSFAQLDI